MDKYFLRVCWIVKFWGSTKDEVIGDFILQERLNWVTLGVL